MKRILQLSSCCFVLSLVMAFAGCATKKIDWNARVGSYTHDQAVTELGPPERSAKLSDGSTVAEWLSRRGMRSGYVSGGIGFGSYYGNQGFYGGPALVTEMPSADSYVRLTFDAGGKLVSWKNVIR